MDAFEWKNYYKNAVVYRIYPKSFSDSDGDGIGDFCGITQKIPYLLSLGVDVISLSSVFETDDDADLGSTNFLRLNPIYGTEEEFEAMLSAIHAAGMKLFLSLSLTCTSALHEWFAKATSERESSFKEYYIWQKGRGKKGLKAPDSQKDAQKQSAWSYDENVKAWYHHALGAKYPTLNYENPRLRKEIVGAFSYWREKGVDGFVIENAYFSIKKIVLSDLKPLYKTNKDLFWTGGSLYQIINEVREKLGRDFPIILNATKVKPGVYPYLAANENPTGDSIFAEQLISGLRFSDHSFKKKKFLHMYISLQKSICKKELSFFFEDHKHRRLLSEFASVGDDLTLVAKLLAGLLLTSTATPVIYQGEEIAMDNFPFKKAYETLMEKENLHTCSPMQWDNAPNAAFSDGLPYLPLNDNYNEINVAAEAAIPSSVLCFYKNFISFRKASSALTMGSFEDYSKRDVIAFIRASDTERLLIIANTTNRHINYSVPSPLLEKEAYCEVCNYPVVSKPIFSTMGLRPYEIRVFRLKAPLIGLN